MVYEVELKVELSKDEKERLEATFEERGFEFRKTTPQKDFWTKVEKSPYADQGGRYDLERYRVEGDMFLYTEKSWELVDGALARKEDEYEVSQENFDAVINKDPNILKLEKVRDWY